MVMKKARWTTSLMGATALAAGLQFPQIAHAASTDGALTSKPKKTVVTSKKITTQNKNVVSATKRNTLKQSVEAPNSRSENVVVTGTLFRAPNATRRLQQEHSTKRIPTMLQKCFPLDLIFILSLN